jgi:hypothetical protein
MLSVLAVLSAAMLIPVVARDGPAQDPDDLERWTAVAPPEPNSDAWFAANHDVAHEWVVTLRDGHPYAKLRSRPVERSDSLPFEIEPGSVNEGLQEHG